MSIASIASVRAPRPPRGDPQIDCDQGAFETKAEDTAARRSFDAYPNDRRSPAMKTTPTIAVLFALAAIAGPAAAQQPSAAGKAAAQPAQPSVEEFDKRMAQIQETMKQMQAQMDKMRQTTDPQERQRLLQEHWTSMQAAMAAMHGIWGPGGPACCGAGYGMGPGMMMGGPMMGWGHMRGYYSNLTPEQLRQRQYMMDQYLPMQQITTARLKVEQIQLVSGVGHVVLGGIGLQGA